MASQVINLKAAGLQTYYQSLLEISPGALLKAKNTVINRPGIIESRRGIKSYGDPLPSSIDRVSQLLYYKERILRHVGTNLAYDNGSGVFTNFLGSYAEPISGYRIKSKEAKSNLYFTTASGVKKLSAKTAADFSSTTAIRDIGCPKALTGTAICYYDGYGFLPPDSITPTSDYFVAYRILWVYTDKNDNLIFGAPSDRFLATNLARERAASVKLVFPIPQGITKEYKYRIYRSEIVQGTTPSDEMNLVYEASPTDAQLNISTMEVSYIDQISEDVRSGGTPLYTNEYSGEGLLQSNEIPPAAVDIDTYKGHMFYANTRLKHYIALELLKTKNSADISIQSGVSDFILSDGTTTETYTFEGKRKSYTIKVPATAASLPAFSYLYFYSANNERKYRMEIQNTSAIGSQPLFPEDGSIVLPTRTFASGANALAITAGIRSSLYSISAAVFDFDAFISTTTNASDTITITNNSNGIADAVFPSWVTYTVVQEGLGENSTTQKVLLSNGFNASASTDGCSWAANSAVITCPGGTTGFTVGKKVMCGPSIPENVYITAVATNSITISRSFTSASTGRMVIQLADTDLSIEQTCKSLIRVLNKSSTMIAGYYASVSSGSPGKMILQRKSYGDSTFYIGTSDSNIVEFFTPALSKVIANTAIANTNPTTITTTSAHGLSINDSVIIFGASSSADINGIQTVIALGATPTTQYQIQKAVTSSSVMGKTMTTTLKSSNEATGNRLYYSKFQEHEAVPLINYIDVGSRDSEILRILALKESMFIFKKDGVFRLTGVAGTSPVWDVTVFDNTVIIIAPDSAVRLANECYFLSNQGYVKLNEASLMYVSPAIENKILPFINTTSSIATASFSLSYESDRALLAFTISSKTDTYATVCYRYNIMTQTWTEWDVSKKCGVLHTKQDRMYFGSASDNYLEVERKNFDRFDYADRDIDCELLPSNLNGTYLKLYNFDIASKGDVAAQTQYVTLYQFNSLLRKLDSDNNLLAHSFYDDCHMESGDDLTAAMTSLVAKLQVADPSVNYAALWSASTNFQQIQVEFNLIVDALNNSTGTYFKNYKHSTGSHMYEAVVTEVDFTNKHLSLEITPSFMSGAFKLYKGIPTEIQYSPQHAGDVAGHKQFSTGTFLFERRSFRHATIAYNSDISDNFEEIDFLLNYAGSFGCFTWGEDSVWGGQGDQAQIRTYIPLRKQKCRFLGCKFTHNTAFESFQLYGISLSVRIFAINDRDYK